MPADTVELGRTAYLNNEWNNAYDNLSAAHQTSPLSPEDLELLSIAALLSNRIEEGRAFREQAHQAHLDAGNIERAAHIAIWNGLNLLQDGEFAVAGGWIAKGQRLISEPHRDCVEHGYLLVPQALQATFSGQFDAAYEFFAQAEAIGERFDDRDLVVLVRHGRGRSLIGKGEVEKGITLLDEAMLEITSPGIFPMVVGIVYCSVIDACRDIFDFRRAQEWTAALDRWSATQPDATPFRGQCLVFRAEFKGMHGAWAQALEEATVAASRLSEPPPHHAAGAAHYQRGELHRLRGDLDAAEDSYTQASELGHSPHPGMALLRIEQNRTDAASAAISREFDEATEVPRRCRLLPAYVEIMLASGDIGAAHRAADELENIAKANPATFLTAVAGYATGSVLLEEANARAALPHLRTAQSGWRELDAPYELARTSVLISLAYKTLGDEDTSALEMDAARRTFERLGAVPALARLDRITGKTAPAAGLTGREVEVLALIATGKTNREIASDLVISEKTVARHIANIFVKLDLSSRAAATAYAIKNGLA